MDEKYPLALPQGTVLAGQYVIEKTLGQGGFGITYRAKDHKTGQPVAVKEFFPDAMATRTQQTTVMPFSGERGESFTYGKSCFLQEAETLAKFIGNEGIVRVHTYFEENGTAYFVMDYVEGTSFEDYIKNKGGKISYEDAERILLPVIDALAAVHSKGIVHRDVTPDNIYITNDGSVKLLDFGAARYSLGDKSRSLDVVLKHGFAPKEQYTRRGKQGPFTDVYAVGATFYFAITGKRPPDSIERIDEDDLIPPSSRGVQISQEKEDAILQALSIQPQDRFQSMEVFKKALLAGEPAAQTDSGTDSQGNIPNTGMGNGSLNPNMNPMMMQGNNPNMGMGNRPVNPNMMPGNIPNTGMGNGAVNPNMMQGNNPNMGMGNRPVNPNMMPGNIPNTGMGNGAVNPNMMQGSNPNMGMGNGAVNPNMMPGGNPNMGMGNRAVNPNMMTPARKKKWVLPVCISAAVVVIAVVIVLLVIKSDDDGKKVAENQPTNPTFPVTTTEPAGDDPDIFNLPSEEPAAAPSEEPEIQELPTYSTQEVVGNTIDNIRHQGAMTTDDKMVYYAYPGGGLKVESLDGTVGYFAVDSGNITSISQDEGMIYYLNDNRAYQISKDYGAPEMISCLDGYLIEEMSLTDDFFVIYIMSDCVVNGSTYKKGVHVFDRSLGTYVGGLNIPDDELYTIANGKIYYITDANDGTLWSLPLNDLTEPSVCEMNGQGDGRCYEMATDGRFIYIRTGIDGEKHVISQYDTFGEYDIENYHFTYENGWDGYFTNMTVVDQQVYFKFDNTVRTFLAEPGGTTFDVDTVYTKEEDVGYGHIDHFSVIWGTYLGIYFSSEPSMMKMVSIDGSQETVTITAR